MSPWNRPAHRGGHLRDFMGVHYEIIVDVGGFKWMVQTTDFVDVDEHIGIVLEPDASTS